MLIYKGMDIGTAKPSLAERRAVPYYGLDCVTPAQDFNAHDWLLDAERARLEHPNTGLFVTGGTGLYYSVLLRGLEPTAPVNPTLRATLESLSLEALQARLKPHNVTLADPNNPRRIIRALEHLEQNLPLPQSWQQKERPILYALRHDRARLHARIEQRVHIMYHDGLVEEVKALLDLYPTWSRTALQAIGYAEVIDLLKGTCTEKEAIERTIIRTRQLAKRQETYLRGQFDTHWIDVHPTDTIDTLADKIEALWQL
jgi:tRNA dimethylallyltransferase